MHLAIAVSKGSSKAILQASENQDAQRPFGPFLKSMTSTPRLPLFPFGAEALESG